MDGASVGGQPFGDRHADCALVVGKRDPVLHRAFPVGGNTDQFSALVILDGAPYDLRGRSRALVDQHHQRDFGSLAVFEGPICGTLAVAILLIEDNAITDKLGGNFHCGLQAVASVR